MKPRLDAAQLTKEDGTILANWIYRHEDPIWHRMLTIARESDRRDAELMLRIAHAVQLGSSAVDQHQAFFPCHWCHRWYPGWYTFSGFRCECRDVNITNFA